MAHPAGLQHPVAAYPRHVLIYFIPFKIRQLAAGFLSTYSSKGAFPEYLGISASEYLNVFFVFFFFLVRSGKCTRNTSKASQMH